MGGLIRRQETDCHLFSLCSQRKKVHSSCCKTIISAIQILTDENWNGSSLWKLQFFLYRENMSEFQRSYWEICSLLWGMWGFFTCHASPAHHLGQNSHRFSLTFSTEHPFHRSRLFNFVLPLDAGLAQAAVLPLCLYCLSYVEANRFLETSTKRRLWSLLVGDAVQPPPQYICKCLLAKAWKEGAAKMVIVACFTASQKP